MPSLQDRELLKFYASSLSSVMGLMDDVPHDVLQHVFRWLELTDLVRAGGVCSRWRPWAHVRLRDAVQGHFSRVLQMQYRTKEPLLMDSDVSLCDIVVLATLPNPSFTVACDDDVQKCSVCISHAMSTHRIERLEHRWKQCMVNRKYHRQDSIQQRIMSMHKKWPPCKRHVLAANAKSSDAVFLWFDRFDAMFLEPPLPRVSLALWSSLAVPVAELRSLASSNLMEIRRCVQNAHLQAAHFLFRKRVFLSCRHDSCTYPHLCQRPVFTAAFDSIPYALCVASRDLWLRNEATGIKEKCGDVLSLTDDGIELALLPKCVLAHKFGDRVADGICEALLFRNTY